MDKSVEENFFERYAKFRKSIELKNYSLYDQKYVSTMISMLDQSITAIKNRSYELSYVGLCCVIEGLASQIIVKNNYMQFPDWIKDNLNSINLPTNPNGDVISKENFPIKYSESIAKNWKRYNEIFGARKNFTKIIMDTYIETKTAPGFFICYETIKLKGITRTQVRNKYITSEELFKEMENHIKDIYDNYRSPIVHSGKQLFFPARIMSKLGGSKTPEGISVQAFGDIVIDVLEHHLEKLENKIK